MTKITSKLSKGLKFDRHFTREGIKPEDMFTFDLRTSVIKNPDGGIVFKTSGPSYGQLLENLG